MTTSFAPGLAFHQRFASPNSNSTEKMRIIPTAPPSVQEDEKPASAQPPACVIEQFTIGWICALQEEYQAACQMLDEELEPHDAETTIMNDESIYVFGKLGDHYVVVGCLPMGGTGIASATRVATDMARSFPNLKFALMVGIGGGAPNIAKKRDIRLGDVVVSVPQGQQAGVVQLDFGVRLPNGSFKRRGHLDAPPKALLGAIQEVQRRQQDRRKPDNLAEHIRRMENMLDYQRPPRDRLYKSSYNHQQATTDQTNDEDEFEDPCCNCLDEWLVRRRERNSFRQVTTHYGTIASDNVVMRDAKARDVHSSDENLNILCFEMEAAGLMNNLRCLVIRGICDYADSHKNDDWHNYAALVAAAYARELLLVLRKVHVTVMPSWVGEIRRIDSKLNDIRNDQQYQNEMAAKEATRAEQERIAAQEHRENEARHNFKLSVEALKSHLEDKDDNQPSADIYGKAKGDVHNGTCTWLFNRHEFTEWIAPESKHPILWLNGKHGAGKTVLCSKAIDHLETTQESLVIIHQFLSNDDYIPKNRLLRIFSTELLHHILKQRTIALPTSIKPFLNVRKNESSKLEELIDCLILELPLTYIFIDGLDEVESSIQKRHSSVSDRSHWEQDVQELMSFLFRKAVLRPEKLRVWCSSQSLPRIRNHLYNDNWRHALLEIGMATGDTKSDIKKYLMSSISESTDPMGSMFAELFVGAALATEVEGSFLWASSMLRDLKMRADTPHDLIELARQGLPSRMSEVYQQVINRIKERDGKMSNPPLWKIVLSLLTFAKRPLKVGEVREAIAMIWTSNGNLDKFKVVPKDKILNSCVSLIWCSNTKEDDTGILRLSHSAVRKHVLENIDLGIDSTDDNGLGGSWIIRECCLRYLSQPRYAKPLRKLSPTGSWACDNEHITSQQLLLYAAKYWFQHFDTPVDANSGDNIPEAERDKVKKFLYSPQFRTCIQVQSLFVTGHFLQRFDPITDRGILIRKTLPNWTQQYEDTLNQQYLYFQGEWCRLLQFGRFTGEMDRCLWSALGPEHFFSHGQSRYHNFQFRQSEKVEQTRNRCQVQHVSQDGRRLMVAWIHEENRCLCLEHWKLDGKRDPQIKSTTIIPFSENANHLSRYSSPCSQTFRSIPLLPRVQSVAPVDAMAIRLDASLIRIGSKMYYWSPGSNDALGSYMPLEESFGESWEEVCVRDSFLVLCRQRIYRQQPKTTTEERERERVRWMRNQRETFERSRSRTRSGSSRVRLQVKVKESKLIPSFVIEETDSDSLTTQSDSSESIPNYEEFPDFSAAEESWSDRSTSTKYASSDDLYSHGSDDSKSDDSDSDIKSQLSGDDTESDIKSVLSVESDDENSSGSESIMSMSRVTWSSESESEDSCIGGDLSEDEIIEAEPAEIYAEPLCPVGISQPQSKKICDCCNRGHLREWYHCIICNNGDLDLCESCESRGMWCLDLEHQLYRIVNRKPTGVVSRRNFSVRQELVVYQMDKPENERLVFHFRNKYPTMLHDSAPVIHPTKPLVVWSLCDSLLLFADFNNNTYFEQKIKAKTSKKAHQICANLSFSPCGAFLRVAIIDATAQKPNSVAALDINGSDTTKRRLCLNLHVLILRLSATSPTKNPPKLLRTTSCLLGCSCARPFIPVLPFAFTWTDADLYLTISESYLRVYHVALPDLREQHCDSVDTPTGISSGFTITVPGETILLPRSSHNRSVQFFPATKPGGNATVIIGPRGGYHPSPPIGVYLSERDLGIWVCPEERNEGGGMYNPQITLEGQLEEPWDDDNDCIIIPFDGY